MIDFPVVLPIGARTSSDLPRKAGNVTHAWLDDDIAEHASELADLINGDLDPKLKRREHRDALGALRSLKGRASRGQLRVGRDNTYPARIMEKVPYVIELRPLFDRGNPAPRLFRLYYAEPTAVDDALLPLVLSTKPHGPDIHNEQNASLEDAKARSRMWLLLKSASERSRK